MITLGQASNYSFGQVWRHTFAWGTKRDSERLRAALAEKYGAQPENIALYHTGRSALAAALQAVAPEGGARVIIPGLTCIAVVRAVRAAGCEPVFVDIEPENLEYNYEKLEAKLAECVFAEAGNRVVRNTIDNFDNVCYNRVIILIQNTLGIPWHVSKIEKLAKKYHATIVEDLAHSAGRVYHDGRAVGTVGAAAALSFGKGKAIDTISGGALILRSNEIILQPSRRPKLSDRLRDRFYPLFGAISRGLCRVKLGAIFMGGLVKIHFVQRSADAELDLSRRLTHWQAKLALRQLSELPETRLRDFRLVENRPTVLSDLRRQGYYLEEIWYDTPVSPRRYAEEADFPATDCPMTVEISQQIINLPTWYPENRLTKAYEIVKRSEHNREAKS